MSSHQERNQVAQAIFYGKNAEKLNRLKVLKRIIDGTKVKPDSLTTYDIRMSEIPEPSKIHPEILKLLKAREWQIIKSKMNLVRDPVPTSSAQVSLNPPALKTLKMIDPSIPKKKKITLKPITMDDVEGQLDKVVANKKITPKTKMNIMYNIKKILDTFGCDMPQLIDQLKDYENVIKVITEAYPDYPQNFIGSLVSLAKHNVPNYRTRVGVEALEQYSDATKRLIKKNEDRHDDTNAVDWNIFLNIAKRYEKTSLYSQEHLISSLYTLLPVVRDDWGKVKIIDGKVNKIPLSKKGSQGNLNYYIPSERKLVFQTYKGSLTKGDTIIIVNDNLAGIIDGSLKKNPRDWLITQNGNRTNEIYANGKLSKIVKDIMTDEDHPEGYTIRQMRHSICTYLYKDVDKQKFATFAEFAHRMMHSVGMQMKYVQKGK
jgi:hypothetical protein